MGDTVEAAWVIEADRAAETLGVSGCSRGESVVWYLVLGKVNQEHEDVRDDLGPFSIYGIFTLSFYKCGGFFSFIDNSLSLLFEETCLKCILL